jgi:prolyl oligopeptidase
VADPYRYLEDPDSAETKQFVEEQNKLTMPYIRACGRCQAFAFLTPGSGMGKKIWTRDPDPE